MRHECDKDFDVDGCPFRGTCKHVVAEVENAKFETQKKIHHEAMRTRVTDVIAIILLVLIVLWIR